MLELSRLEAAVIDLLVRSFDGPQREQLQLQQTRLSVEKRVHTGVGCFTYFIVEAGLELSPPAATTLHGAYAQIEGMPSEVGFALSIDDGKIKELEAFSLAGEEWPEVVGGFTLRFDAAR